MMTRVAFFFLGWAYLLAFGWVWSLLPFQWPCPDVVLLMALYASKGSYGPEEVFGLGLLADALSGSPLGLGAAGKVTVFLLFGRTLALLGSPFWAPFSFAFGLSLLDLVVEGGLKALVGWSAPFFPPSPLKGALITASFSYVIFACNDAILGPFEVPAHGRRR